MGLGDFCVSPVLSNKVPIKVLLTLLSESHGPIRRP